MSLAVKLLTIVGLLGLAACAQQEEPAPAPVVVEPEPVFTGKV